MKKSEHFFTWISDNRKNHNDKINTFFTTFRSQNLITNMYKKKNETYCFICINKIPNFDILSTLHIVKVNIEQTYSNWNNDCFDHNGSSIKLLLVISSKLLNLIKIDSFTYHIFLWLVMKITILDELKYSINWNFTNIIFNFNILKLFEIFKTDVLQNVFL